MTLPVAWERRAPAAAAAAVAIGATVNELLIGPLVRCGAALPAVFAIAFFAGTRCGGRRLAVGLAFCLGAVVTQSFFDPQLGPAFLVAGLPVTAGFCLAGQLVRSRGHAAAALRDRNAELRAQREQTAQLAVAADRARVAGGLDSFLRDRITTMAAAAAAGREQVFTDPAAADGAFAAISVVNGPAAAAPSGLERTGGSRGLAGLRERAAACGGDLTAGPASDGGWQVLARLPVQPDPAASGPPAGDHPLASGPGTS